MSRALRSSYLHHSTVVLQNLVLFDRLEVLKWIAGVVLARTCLAGSNPRSSTIIQRFCRTPYSLIDWKHGRRSPALVLRGHVSRVRIPVAPPAYRAYAEPCALGPLVS